MLTTVRGHCWGQLGPVCGWSVLGTLSWGPLLGVGTGARRVWSWRRGWAGGMGVSGDRGRVEVPGPGHSRISCPCPFSLPSLPDLLRRLVPHAPGLRLRVAPRCPRGPSPAPGSAAGPCLARAQPGMVLAELGPARTREQRGAPGQPLPSGIGGWFPCSPGSGRFSRRSGAAAWRAPGREFPTRWPGRCPLGAAGPCRDVRDC